MTRMLAGPFAGSTHESRIDRVRFVSEDVAIVDGVARITDLRDEPSPITHAFTDVFVRRAGHWAFSDRSRVHVPLASEIARGARRAVHARALHARPTRGIARLILLLTILSACREPTPQERRREQWQSIAEDHGAVVQMMRRVRGSVVAPDMQSDEETRALRTSASCRLGPRSSGRSPDSSRRSASMRFASPVRRRQHMRGRHAWGRRGTLRTTASSAARLTGFVR